MFLLELLFILFSGLSVGAIVTYIIERSLGGIIMTMDFTSVPVYMIVAVLGAFGCAVVKYLYDEHKEGKKTSRIDMTTTDTKQIVQGVDKKLDYHSEAMKEQSDKQFQMQYTKLDNIDKFVVESRALNQAATGGKMDIALIIAAVQNMAIQNGELQKELADTKEKLKNVELENRKLTQRNKNLQSEQEKKYKQPGRHTEEPEL